MHYQQVKFVSEKKANLMKAAVLTSTAATLLLLCACQTFTSAAVRVQVDLDYVTEEARALAGQPYDPRQGRVPEYLRELSYDQVRSIRFNPLKALWREEQLPFQIEFFHPGGLHNQSVTINEFTATHVQEIRFSPAFFDYSGMEEIGERVSTSLGYAGLRVRYPINRVDIFDEFAVFLGSSYFRLIGRDQTYGLSARGLALDTGLAVPEEFPRFREFWLGKPKPGDRSLLIYALLDGPRVTGAYAFRLKPGHPTTATVEGRLFFRDAVQRVGLAPFSSMFYFGENTLTKPADYRPEVHDSDGVLIEKANGERIWRPLTNPDGTRTSLFAVDGLRGFGLFQRDRSYESYEDIEAAYHRRPSAWVEPIRMPPGRVVLFEYHTQDEVNDNVALFYELRDPVPVGEVVEFSYRLHFGDGPGTSSGYVEATRTGHSPWKPDVHEIVIDFRGPSLAELSEVEPVTFPVTSTANGLLEQTIVQKNRYNDSWRVILHLRRTAPGPIEMDGRLELDGQPLSEIWSYQWID